MDVLANGRSLTPTKPLTPGYLVTPFRWAAQPLAAMIQADPGLLTQVFELDRSRKRLPPLHCPSDADCH